MQHHHYRDPPPYPGSIKQLSQPGYRQSYSGSETSTDISLSSTENLSTSLRQDPPGEENQTPTPLPVGAAIFGRPNTNVANALDIDFYNSDGSYSILAQLAAKHTQPAEPGLEVRTTNSSTFYVTGGMAPNMTHDTMVTNRNSAWDTSTNTIQSARPGWSTTQQPNLSQPSQNTMVQSQSQSQPMQLAQPQLVQSNLVQSLYMTSQPKTALTHTQSMQYFPQQGPPSKPQLGPMQSHPNPSSYPSGGHLHPHTTPTQTWMFQSPGSGDQSATMKPKTTSQKIASIFKGKNNPNRSEDNESENEAQHVSPLAAKIFEDSQQRQHQKQQLLQQQQQSKKQQLFKQQKHLQQQIQHQYLLQQQQQQVKLPVSPVNSPPPPPEYTPPPYKPPSLPAASLQDTKCNLQKENSNPQDEQKNLREETRSLPEGKQNKILERDVKRFLPEGIGGALPGTNSRHMEGVRAELRRSFEMLDKLEMTRSQPDLTRLIEKGQGQAEVKGHKEQEKPHNEPDYADIAVRASKMVEMLSSENKMLREELETYYSKITKLQKFELEIQKAQENYDMLVKSSEKRENLEKAMRCKLDNDIKKIQDNNRDLKAQLSTALAQLASRHTAVTYNEDSDLIKELSDKDKQIEKLDALNRELQSSKERLDVEISAQRSTLQEQRTHIDVLDSALHNAQANILQLEDQVKKAQQLQSAFQSLQATSAKREGIEKKMRNKLEQNVQSLKTLNKESMSQSTESLLSIEDPNSPQVPKLKKTIIDQEQRILALESEKMRWEEKYIEEVALRDFAVDVASTPKDAKIAELERNTEDTNKLIAEAQTDRLKNQEEVYEATRKLSTLEAKIKTLQAQMAEKDAMIRVLQKHTLNRSTSVSSLFGSPVHTPTPSMTSQVSVATPTRPSSGPSSRPNSRIQSSLRGLTLALHSKQGSTTSTKSAPGIIEEKKLALNRKLSAPTTASMLNSIKVDSKEPVQQRLWQV
ncbi:unnamed protein product [Owenia fusiformis]|uniref:Uncharacterized protein n=1 Tax=Owenia fusiformis TaxID=6347 RepID=A0A8J1Y2Y0_OWEFU|nr:unnamed protein product [Owenia fusiformis]